MRTCGTSALTCLAALTLLLPMAGCDVEGDEEIDDAEFRGGNWGYHRALAKFVRKRATKQGITPMERAPEVREELVELGQALAFDKILSGNKDISCMTCHHPTLASDDDLPLSIGQGGVGLGEDRVHPEGTFVPRNAPPLFNLHAMDTMFWDGRVSFHGEIDTPADEQLTQEMLDVFEFGAASAQAMFPVLSRAEMRGKLGTNELSLISDSEEQQVWTALMARLGEVPEYVEMFEEAYPGTDFEDMTFAHAANAIAGFEIAGFEAAETPWDEFLRGDDWALTTKQLRGARHFLGKAGCSDCHGGSSLSDFDFHNTALAQFGPGKGDGASRSDDWGRYGVTDDPGDFYRFRTAPLRNVELTGPWGHTGQYDDLGEFIRHYVDPEASLLNFDAVAEGVPVELAATQLPTEEAILRHLSPILIEDTNLNENRIPAVVAFLESLTDPESLDLDHTIPEEVPSGLPVEDNVLFEPDNFEGSFTVPWTLPGSTFFEYQLQRPEMCDGGGEATVSFDRNANTLAIDAHFEGLPYRPDACYEYNPGNGYNEFPDCVEDGKWQIWVVPRSFTTFVPYWYDLDTGDLIASDWELEEPPDNAFSITLPAFQMVCTPLFESDPETLVADVHFEYEFDNILDMLGSAGVAATIIPPNIYDPSELIIYYTEGGLPPEYAMDFGDMIEDLNEGKGGLGLGLSLEPDPKPNYLRARDNLMLGWSATFPQSDLIPEPEEECGTDFQWDGVQVYNPVP